MQRHAARARLAWASHTPVRCPLAPAPCQVTCSELPQDVCALTHSEMPRCCDALITHTHTYQHADQAPSYNVTAQVLYWYIPARASVSTVWSWCAGGQPTQPAFFFQLTSTPATQAQRLRPQPPTRHPLASPRHSLLPGLVCLYLYISGLYACITHRIRYTHPKQRLCVQRHR